MTGAGAQNQRRKVEVAVLSDAHAAWSHSDTVNHGDEKSANSECFLGTGSFGPDHSHELTHCHLCPWLQMEKQAQSQCRSLVMLI